jgi:hypothetical protein
MQVTDLQAQAEADAVAKAEAAGRTHGVPDQG